MLDVIEDVDADIVVVDYGADHDNELKSELLVAQGLRCRPFVAGDGSAGDRRSDRALLALFMFDRR